MASEMQKTGVTNRKLWLQCPGDFASSLTGTPMILPIGKLYQLFSETSYIFEGRSPSRRIASEGKVSEVGAAFF